MHKKIRLLIISIVIIIIIIAFNGYKLVVYNEFKNYLGENYPDKSFNLNWVKSDFIYWHFYDIKFSCSRFYASVYCNNDGTEFNIRKNGIKIYENYLLTRNRLEMNKTINSHFQDKEVSQYIRSLNVGEDKKVSLDTDESIDFNKIVDRVSVYYHNNSIQDNKQFAQVSHEIVQVLKNNGVNLSSIDFVNERDDKLYELSLKGYEINNEAEDILKLIRRLK